MIDANAGTTPLSVLDDGTNEPVIELLLALLQLKIRFANSS